MRLDRLYHSARLLLIRGYRNKANYLKKHNILGGMGEKVNWGPALLPIYPKLIKLHNNVSIHKTAKLVPHDVINAFLKKMDSSLDFGWWERVGCIEIMDNVYVCEGVTILPNVKIGANCIISAGSVVSGDIPGNSIVAGNPAKVIGQFDAYVASRLLEKDNNVKFKNQSLPDEITEDLWIRFDKRHEETASKERNGDSKKKVVVLSLSEYKEKIVAAISKEFPMINLSDTNLVTDHKIDSLKLISIISILNEVFEVEIPYYEISPDNFDDVDKMAALVQRLNSGDEESVDETETVNRQKNDSNKDYDVATCKTLIEYVKQHAEKNPDKLALIANNETMTYSKLFEYSEKYAAVLKNAGLKKGDRVVVKSIQSIDYILIYMGIHRAGGVVTAVEKSSGEEVIRSIADNVQASMIISDNPAVVDGTGWIFMNSGSVREEIMKSSRINTEFPSGEDSADILFTTGTTGQAKGVEISHTAVIAGAENIAYGCEMKKDTVLVVPNPLSHSNAIKNMGAVFITGCTFYILDGITDVKAYFKALDTKYGRVATVLPPAAIRTLVMLAKDKLTEYKDKLDYLMAATAPLPEPDRDTLREMLPNTRLYNHYGCSESSSICIYDFNKYASLKKCAGKPMPHSHVFFVDDDKKEIISSPDNIGLLAVRGDATMKGYYGAKELTDEIKDGDIIYTKDMGYIDEDGFVFILGRNDDIINVGGLKVSPLEVEDVALAYEGVAECICISVKDDITGEAIKLLVVKTDSYDEEVLMKQLNEKLDSYKVPKYVEEVDMIQRTYNGKINRKYYKNK